MAVAACLPFGAAVARVDAREDTVVEAVEVAVAMDETRHLHAELERLPDRCALSLPRRPFDLEQLCPHAVTAGEGDAIRPDGHWLGDLGHDFLVLAFAVVIVGGMGSIVGAVIAALFLSQVQGLASLWISPVWAETLVYCVMLLVLLLRPSGLFNRIGEA